jgi:hypothetical protein
MVRNGKKRRPKDSEKRNQNCKQQGGVDDYHTYLLVSELAGDTCVGIDKFLQQWSRSQSPDKLPEINIRICSGILQLAEVPAARAMQ